MKDGEDAGKGKMKSVDGKEGRGKEEKVYIEMELGLGVLEEKKVKAKKGTTNGVEIGGQSSSEESESSSEEEEEEGEEEDDEDESSSDEASSSESEGEGVNQMKGVVKK